MMTRRTVPIDSRRSWMSKISSPWLAATLAAASRIRSLLWLRGVKTP
jgi:hypothetical protein